MSSTSRPGVDEFCDVIHIGTASWGAGGISDELGAGAAGGRAV